MDDLLKPLQSRRISDVERNGNTIEDNIEARPPRQQDFSINSSEDVLEALKSQPDSQFLCKVLRWLDAIVKNPDGFNIKKPGPKAAQITYILVNDVVPNHWHSLRSSDSLAALNCLRLLQQCLRSVAGIGAIISRLRLLNSLFKESSGRKDASALGRMQSLEVLLDFTGYILEGEKAFAIVWGDLNSFFTNPSLKSLYWKEFLSLVASGKLLSLASEAAIQLKNSDSSLKISGWVEDGRKYAGWLGVNIQYMLKSMPRDHLESRNALTQLLSKSLTLGYTDQVVLGTCSGLFKGDEASSANLKDTIQVLTAHERKTVLYTIVRLLSRHFLPQSRPSSESQDTTSKAIGGAAVLILALTDDNSSILELLVSWLIGPSAEASGQTHNAHRAVIAALSSDKELLKGALQKSLELLGDKLYIKHTPILHQEVNAQITLLLFGNLYRVEKNALLSLAHSSIYLNAISNRLAASSDRARSLGMMVGNSISELVDPIDTRMKFSLEHMEGSETRWYQSLTKVNDSIGSISDLRPLQNPKIFEISPSKTAKPQTRPVKAVSAKTTSKIISIGEVDDGPDDHDDLPMYQKADSDPLDEDEDPTLVQRDKPTAPVYITDLIAGLRDTENFDRNKLSLETASSLIRRKAAFGTEVSDNVEELATILVGLNDRWELEDFSKLRLQGMIAVLVAEPLKMGQWFSMTFYNGDYSMSQRASVLTTLGLGARELAGLGKEDTALTGANVSGTSFPSKQLPDKMHKIYAVEAGPMNSLSHQLERTMIQPMAAEAADQVIGPNALKVRTFSSRMAVEKKRTKAIPNKLAKLVAEGFFFPLTGRWRTHIQSFAESTSHTSPFLLSHFLKTLSLILHASGSSTLSLPQMTSEFWDLLLSLRPRATDPAVLESLLFAFLTLLDINEDGQKRLADEHAKELLETQGWVEGIFERVGGGSAEGDRVRMLATGVLMRVRVVVEKYQRMLMGDLVDFM